MPSVTAEAGDLDRPRLPRGVVPAGFKPWQPGQSGNPGGRTKLEAECRRLAQEKSLHAIERMAQIVDSDDERAALVACNSLLDRAYGKPKEMAEDTRKALIDVAKLGPERLAMLSALLREVMAVAPGPNVTDVPDAPHNDAAE